MLNARGSERLRVLFAGGGGANQSTTATTAANSTAWIDMQVWDRALVIGVRVKGTGDITANTGVYVSASATGTSPTAVTTLGVTGDVSGLITAAVGTILKPNCGHVVFDVSADEIADALAGGRYISGRCRKKTRADRISWIYILLDPKLEKTGNMPTGTKNQNSTITAP